MLKQKIISTDVLVVGGGIAGCFAAIAACNGGASVIQADKGYVGSSGQTPYAGTFMVFDPQQHDKSKWIELVRHNGDYLAHLGWTELTFDRSKECYEDLISFGVPFAKNDDGTNCFIGGMGDEGTGWSATVPDVPECAQHLRKASLKAGTTILDRTMIVELLVEEGKVCGALGLSINNAQPVVIYAKSVILATGASTLKPPGWPVSNLTGDGDMMAYRAGVAITGKEFTDGHSTTTEEPNYLAMDVFTMKMMKPGHEPPPGGKFEPTRDAYGEPVNMAPNLNLGPEFVIHAGRGPVVRPKNAPGPKLKVGNHVNCAAHGMACHKTEGLWPEALDASTTLSGLYGAGDSLGTMMSGAAYASIGLAFTGSAVTGKVAGESAIAYIKHVGEPSVPQEKVDSLLEHIYAPLERKGGFTPDWLITYLQNLTMPYFVLRVKEESRLQGVLDQVRYAKSHLVPKLYATDAHGLRLAIEAKNMVENTEIKLLACMARKESRGTHYREDYPTRDEAQFSGWITIRNVDGTPVIENHPMPKEWAWKEGEPRLVNFPTEF